MEQIRDACGVGLLADIQGRPSRAILAGALEALRNLAHRGAVDADGKTGDGAGVLTQIPRFILGEFDAAGLVFGADRQSIVDSLARRGLTRTAWRDVPTNDQTLGPKAMRCRPDIAQILVRRPAEMDAGEFERRLLDARRHSEVYLASLSSRTIVYKALVRSTDLADFYDDLNHPEYETAFALFHQRFSTNTVPSWSMSQPFPFLAHNGEINTISGNRHAMRARGHPMKEEGISDSASLDEALAILMSEGRSLPHAVKMLIPPAWENDLDLSPEVRAFYEHHASLMEPWDGPAFITFADGRVAGAALDRNGLRPARYLITTDDLLLVASEAGVIDIDDARVRHRGRIGPGGMIGVDLVAKKLFDGDAVVEELAARTAYQMIEPETLSAGAAYVIPRAPCGVMRAFGYTREEMRLILDPLSKGIEPVGSMGDDAPLAILSAQPRLFFSYFRQRFAQVTNPPIDSLRESIAMSLRPDPLLDSVTPSGEQLSILFTGTLATALDQLLKDAAAAVRRGRTILVLTDRAIDEEHAAIPSLLAVSAVHQHLIREGLRTGARIIADTGEARDEHHLAALIAFGADAVCPWLANAIIGGPDYRRSLHKGLLKILAKMGVCTIRSYRGSQLFEAIGIASEVIDRHFTGTPSPIGGLGLREIEAEVRARHSRAFNGSDLDEGSFLRYRRDGEAHAYAPHVVKALHRDYRAFAELVHSRESLVLRDLLEFRDTTPIAISDVEPVSAVVPRLMTAAMSLGALSPEAQHVIAVAMNRLGGRSNSGEGGEPSASFWPAPARSENANHRIKQIASGRFGVTAEYVVSADELQIKIAQGSKPGEGGQLPEHKVTAHIAEVRRAEPGTALISPPPHHDIYSIEDLAQLIYDLKRVNPAATVSVKLVSSAGIGTIAVGVAKAHADAIEISGHDGGTGASPLGSIKNAGAPWELGLTEVQQSLVRAGLRSRVRLQVNGGLKTGRDVVIAALLGAEEFGFGTAALIAAGCVMARQCHLNTCPAGIATQREDLRARFNATPDDVIRFFTAVAEETREILALLGARSLRDIIGRADLLEQRIPADGKASTIRLDHLLETSPINPSERRWAGTRNDPPRTGSGIDDLVIRRMRLARTVLEPIELSLPVATADRAVGGRIAGAIVRRYRGHGAPPDTVRLLLRGSAGQSFGAFCVGGMSLVLEGEANDYVGKSMSGGEIIIRPPRRTAAGTIAGNTILYGATGGQMFLAGRAGERFAVRNSGAIAVVEGTGDHACEYMTAGAVVILGPTGRNTGAGMSGGMLFVLDEEERLEQRINSDSVAVDAVMSGAEETWLWEAIVRHLHATGSRKADNVLKDWKSARPIFRRVAPAARLREDKDLPTLVSTVSTARAGVGR